MQPQRLRTRALKQSLVLLASALVGALVVMAVNHANASRRSQSLSMREVRACNELLARVGDAQHRKELLFGVVRAGDASAVATLLDCGLDANARGPSDRTLLEVAAYQGHESVVRELLVKGADPNAGDRLGLTPLMNAAFRGEDRIVTELLRSGATVDATNRAGQTALMFAALFGRHSTVAILEQAGADRTKQDLLGFSAATLSLAANPAETAHRFLRAGIRRTVDLAGSLR